jgi:hypothetical protein
VSGLFRRLAPVALLAASAPWTLGPLLVHRHAHAHEGSAPASHTDWALHGHDHESGTPDHDHPVLTASTTALGRLASFGLTLGSSSAAFGLDEMGECRGHLGRLVARARNGPLRAAPTVSILRV